MMVLNGVAIAKFILDKITAESNLKNRLNDLSGYFWFDNNRKSSLIFRT